MSHSSERLTVLANPRADHVRKVAALVGCSARSRTGLILIEGPQSLRELFARHSSEVADVYVSEDAAPLHSEFLELARQRARWVHVCTEEVIRETSGDAQELIVVAKKDAVSSVLQKVPTGSAIVLTAQGHDSGNIGTIIRTADAMGAATVITAAGTVEVGNPKVLRASVGSVFHLPIMASGDFESAVWMVHSFKGIVLGTSDGFGTLDPDELTEEARTGPRPLAITHAWAFGNEAKGLPPAEPKACDSLVSISMTGAAESLNVASAAAMCLFASQNARQFH